MSLRLKNPKQVPKDGFVIVDPNSGRRFGGMFSFGYVSSEYLGYLKGNNLPGATRAETDALLDAQTCNRDPSLCYDSSITVQSQVTTSRGCGSCGIKTL